MQMPSHSLSIEEQKHIIRNDGVNAAIDKYLGGDSDRLGELFSISWTEYLSLVPDLPLDEWVRTREATQDGIYLIGNDDTIWSLYQQDRGAVLWSKFFATRTEARIYLASETNLGRYLLARDSQVEESDGDISQSQEFNHPQTASGTSSQGIGISITVGIVLLIAIGFLRAKGYL